MEALYLDCGARKPQLKRNPLGRACALTLAEHYIPAMVDTTLKQRILSAVEELPPEATLEDVIERLCFLAKIDRGLAQADAGLLIPHDQIAAHFKR